MLLLLITGSELALAQQDTKPQASCLSLSGSANKVDLLSKVYHLIDYDGSAKPNINDVKMSADSIQKIRSKFVNSKFQSAQTKQLIIPKGKQDHWLRFCLQNTSNTDLNFVLSINPAITDEVDFYPLKVGAPVFKTGSQLNFNTRDIHAPSFDFNIALTATETQEFYIRVKARTRSFITATLSDKNSYLVNKDKLEALDGIFVGVFVGLALYTLLLYFSIPQWSSFFYLSWCLAELILFIAIDGRVLQYFLPAHPQIAFLITSSMYPVGIIFAALFARNFLNLSNHPKLDKLGLFFVALFSISLIAAYLFTDKVYLLLLAFALTVTVYYGVLCPIILYATKKSISSKYLLIAEIPFVLTATDRVLLAIGATTEYYVPYTPKVGLVATMLVLAYYIGLSVHRQKNAAQTLANEQQLKADSLAQLNQAKSDFFANVSHELRTPLTLIQGPLNQLLEKPQEQNTRSSLKGVLKQSKNLQDLVDQLLMLSKYDEHALELKTSKTNISEKVRLLATQFESLAKAKNIDIEMSTQAANLQAYVDLEKLQIIINNLISNAIKFTPENGQIKVGVYNDQANHALAEQSIDNYLEIRVQDNGPGIPNEEHDRIFDRFYQSESSMLAGSGVGTGIGLALVKDLVELHAGYVRASHATTSQSQTEPKHIGAMFSVYLPLGKAHLRTHEILEDKLAPNHQLAGQQTMATVKRELESELENKLNNELTSNTTNAAKAEQSKNHKTILVVDDNADMRAYIASLLKPHYNILQAANGLEAETLVKSHSPNLIITDLMMPKRNGLEFVQSLKQQSDFEKIPVIMLTAKSAQEDRLTGLLAAVDDYLTKPFDGKELQIKIGNLLTKQSQFNAFYAQSNNTATPVKSPPKNPFVAKARAVAEQRMHDAEFGVQELAQQLHISRATLARRLAEEGDFTPSSFLRHCRLEKARQIVNENKLSSLKEVASSVGFKQSSYFARLYEKTFNTKLKLN